MTLKQGWTGRVYEDFEVGDVYQHPLGRTVIAADNIWFTLLTQNTNPIHFDAAYSAQTEYGKPLVDSTFTLALVTGQSVVGRVTKRHGQPGLGRGPPAQSALRRRYRLFPQRSAGKARIKVPAERRHREGKDNRLQAGWQLW